MNDFRFSAALHGSSLLQSAASPPFSVLLEAPCALSLGRLEDGQPHAGERRTTSTWEERDGGRRARERRRAGRAVGDAPANAGVDHAAGDSPLLALTEHPQGLLRRRRRQRRQFRHRSHLQGRQNARR